MVFCVMSFPYFSCVASRRPLIRMGSCTEQLPDKCLYVVRCAEVKSPSGQNDHAALNFKMSTYCGENV